MSRKLSKTYIRNLLRKAYLTKPMANDLFELMKSEFLKELSKGNSINLFGIVNVIPFKHDGKKFGGFMNREVTDLSYRLRVNVNRNTKRHFNELNKSLKAKGRK